MISVDEARAKILENIPYSRMATVPLAGALGSVLAEAIVSPIDTPPFDQSAMDGYAFAFDVTNPTPALSVEREIQAGENPVKPVLPGQAVRIYTGAKLPPGTDSVIMQEKTIAEGNKILLKDNSIRKGTNVRVQGSQTKKGAVALEESSLLTPAALAFLAGLGIGHLKIFTKPAISIIVTGNELEPNGGSITGGKIYESNALGLTAALNQLGINPVSAEAVPDREEKIADAIKSRLSSDILVLTGGVSVGQYDLVPAALEKCGVQKIFHGVRQKPGKPIYFGRKNDTLIFALPGNPGAVLTCFYQYLVPVIGRLTRRNYYDSLVLPLENSYSRKKGLTGFLKGKTGASGVRILDKQESYLLNSFALADCLVELDENFETGKPGDPVRLMKIS
jgi:molybdopterin molybdotransferase